MCCTQVWMRIKVSVFADKHWRTTKKNQKAYETHKCYSMYMYVAIMKSRCVCQFKWTDSLDDDNDNVDVHIHFFHVYLFFVFVFFFIRKNWTITRPSSTSSAASFHSFLQLSFMAVFSLHLFTSLSCTFHIRSDYSDKQTCYDIETSFDATKSGRMKNIYATMQLFSHRQMCVILCVLCLFSKQWYKKSQHCYTFHPERTNERANKWTNKSKYNVLNEQHQRKRHYVSFATKKSKHLANKFMQTHSQIDIDTQYRST